MLTAESGIMFQSVSAIKDILEIPSPVVTDPPPHHQDQWIPADLHHVESMQSVEREMEQLPVLVSQDCLEILTLNASQNVPSTLNAPLTRLVFVRSVLILVLESVAPMQDVQFKTTIQAVLVTQDIQETPSDSAQE